MCGTVAMSDTPGDELQTLRGRDARHQARIAHLEAELHAAGEVRRRLHPPLPHVEGLGLHVLSRPAGPVGGDVCEVFRINESHVALILIDATGHDSAAAFLSDFVARGIRALAKEDGLLDPAALLAHVNDKIIDADLPDCHFATAVCAIFNERTRVIRWARAGAPYPILAHRGRPPRPLKSKGSLLGVMPGATFEVVQHPLAPGDTLVLHTDGLDDFLCGQGNSGDVDAIARTEWMKHVGWLPADQHHRRLDTSLSVMDRAGYDRDDVTLITLQVGERSPLSPQAPVQTAAPASVR